MCWLYYVTNLLVIQHLETLYLSGNHVKVVCERMWRNAQDCALKQALATGSRGWLTIGKPPEDAHERSMQRSWTVMPALALQDKKFRLAIQLTRNLNSRLSQVARPSCQPAMFWKIWLFTFLIYPTINTLISTKCGWLFRKKNPKRCFYNTPTQLERATHFLEKSL